MNKKVIFGGAAAVLAGVGVYLWVSKQQQAKHAATSANDAWTTDNIPVGFNFFG